MQATIDALLWEEWKNDMNAEVASIHQILPNAYAGNYNNNGKKAIVLRRWVRNVLRKIIYYKSRHRRLLKEAESRLQLALPHDIVMNNIVPFLKLPQHTFDGEEEIYESCDGNDSIDGSYSSEMDSDEEEDDNCCYWETLSRCCCWGSIVFVVALLVLLMFGGHSVILLAVSKFVEWMKANC